MTTDNFKPGSGGDDPDIEAARADIQKAEHKISEATKELAEGSEDLQRAEARLEEAEHHNIEVTLIWGGTGASKPAKIPVTDTAGEVFKLVYKEFGQKPTDQDTFEVNEKDFPRSRFSEPVKKLVHEFGPKLSFEVIPPTSGA
ncbi:MAG TPA: hypothetical protein VGN12_16695 [Pirellulales bacterium]|jgi:hypothetical protein